MLPDDKIPSLDQPSPWGWLPRLGAGTFLACVLLFLFAWPALAEWLAPSSGQAAVLSTATATAFEPQATEPQDDLQPTQPALTEPAPTTPASGGVLNSAGPSGLSVLSLSELGYAQLFSHSLSGQQFTRLTSGAWDDISPALSPDGSQLAFASNRSGQWDLYVLDFASGQTAQLTDDPAYDGAPSWSGNDWLAYEHDHNGNLEIAIRPADGSLEPVYVSISPARDLAPAWRPGAQQLAFISDRGGAAAVWLLDLQQEGEARFSRPTPAHGIQAAPAWSPDGRLLAWAEQDDAGLWSIYASDLIGAPRRIGSGAAPRWSPDGSTILTEIQTETESYLAAYWLDGSLALAPARLPGELRGATWAAGALPLRLPDPLESAALAQPEADWAALLGEETQHAASHATVPLSNIDPRQAVLSQAAAGPFEALRARTAELLGWDALSSLEYAFVPLDTPLPPTRQQAWLYTGRAFALRSGLLNAGWLAAVREDIGGQTYWRIYLRTARDGGGMGKPLTRAPWDLTARFNGAGASYQAGGALMNNIPGGYWIDFTALAADYGFERLPAQSNWRSFFHGALFNEFALRAGLSWEQAMLQLYTAGELADAAP